MAHSSFAKRRIRRRILVGGAAAMAGLLLPVASRAQGLAVRTSTSEELGRAQRVEYEALADVVRAAKIKAD